MNVTILRLARRARNGTRHWTIPGKDNGAKLVPSRLTPDGWGAAFHWPDKDPYDGSQIIRGVDLNRHRAIARHHAEKLIRWSKL